MKLTMPGFLNALFEDLHIDESCKAVITPMAREYSELLEPEQHKKYMKVLGDLIWFLKVRYDINSAVVRLATRAQSPTVKDWEAIMRVVRYLFHTRHLGAVISKGAGANNTDITRLYCWVDAAYNCHNDSKSHSGYCFSLNSDVNSGMFYVRSMKQSNIALSSLKMMQL